MSKDGSESYLDSLVIYIVILVSYHRDGSGKTSCESELADFNGDDRDGWNCVQNGQMDGEDK